MYCPFHSLLSEEKKHLFQIYNSHLSEYAALGFEYGYSITNPNFLVIWEVNIKTNFYSYKGTIWRFCKWCTNYYR